MNQNNSLDLGPKRDFLDLGLQPLANGFLRSAQDSKNEYFFPLVVSYAQEFGLVTLKNYVDPPKMFHEGYAYVASQSQTMQKHFRALATSLRERFSLGSQSRVLEIGSNDGIFISLFPGVEVTAVEPCGNFAEHTNSLGIKTFCDFWNADTASKVVQERGHQDLIFSANCMCHIPDIIGAFRAIERCLSSEGVFVFEDPTFVHVLNRGSYDQFYDEHAHIFSLTSLSRLLRIAGLRVFSVENLSVHGGSMRLYACKDGATFRSDSSVDAQFALESHLGLESFSTYEFFSEKIQTSKLLLNKLILSFKERKIPLVAYGATSKSTTIFNYCGIGPDHLECIFDTTPSKQGTLSPGVHIPVKQYTQDWFRAFSRPPFAFLGAWNFLDEIRSKEADFIANGGAFFTHVPYVAVL